MATGEVNRPRTRGPAGRPGPARETVTLCSTVVTPLQPARAVLADPAAGWKLHPVWAEVLCDAETPVAAFGRLREIADAPFLLESVVGGERWARYSFIGLGHRARVEARWKDDALQVDVEPGPGFSLPAGLAGGRGLAAIRRVLAAFEAVPAAGLPRFWGGLVGVWGHDFVRAIEHLPPPSDRPASDLPALELLATDTLVIFDNLTQQVKVVATVCPAADGGAEVAYDRAAERIARVCEALRTRGRGLAPLRLRPDVAFEAEPARPWTRARHLEAVARAREHITAGDVFQVVLSQGFEVPRADLDLLDVYRILRVTNPAPYMYLMNLSATLLGASPEVLVRVDRDTREVTVRPIAGTRPRGRTEDEDHALEKELLSDAKERAEHLMLIDLGRNDVGRIATGGSVQLREAFSIERYSRVMHIVSEVTGRLRPELDALDALASTFPAGTLSGAPKVRALQIIDALEPAARGWYGGAVGYVGYDGGADFAICIRSAVALGDTLRVQAGGGIVYDSVPEAEDQECRNKASAVLRAVAMATLARQEDLP